MKASTIIDRIYEGVYDDDLRAFNEAAIDRLKQLRAENQLLVRAQLRKGTKVRIREDASLRPLYFLGREGKVLSIAQTRAEVDFGSPVGRYGAKVKVPLDCLEVAK